MGMVYSFLNTKSPFLGCELLWLITCIFSAVCAESPMVDFSSLVLVLSTVEGLGMIHRLLC